MNDPDDDLRARLRRLDPAGGLPVDPVSGPRAASSMERAMQILEPPAASRRAPRRTRLLVGAAALGAAAAVTAGVLLTLQGDAGGGDPLATMTLELPASDVAPSCAGFEVATLANMSPAFAGTAVEVGEDSVVLDVDRWYTGGDTDRVVLEVPGRASTATLGFDFQQGERYLVTAAHGVVNACGYSGLATPEFERSFEQAFGD